MAYFNIYDVAKQLPNSPSPEWVLKQIIDPDRDDNGDAVYKITPCYRTNKPILLLPKNVDIPVEFTGRLDIEGLYEGCTIRNEEICFDEPTTSTYFWDGSNGIIYYPSSQLRIPLSSLRLHHDEVECFAILIRSQIEHTKQKPGNILRKASQTLTAHRTAERDRFVDDIMRRIKEEYKKADRACMVINHIRFVNEANVPDERFESVKKQVAKQIKADYGFAGYKALSRAPKIKIVEPYFLLI
jgi:hypothetical protein